ncbi:hypothetical protein MIR68_004781 [Amoeboaphelidium protococcarum]|nr:hypothetical protein MIR68_004781 [Amoeboaphelidium protococcarum]
MAQVSTTGHGMLQSNSSSSLVYTVAQQMEAYVSYQPNLIETQQDILQFWEGAGSVQFLVLAKIVVKSFVCQQLVFLRKRRLAEQAL